ncbi:MAG: hypothetical protein ABUS79_19630, partial [Pseudomonadota bacterium]
MMMLPDRRRRFWSWGLVAAVASSLVALGPRTAAASIMMALDLTDLVKQAEHIAVVEDVGVRAAWDDRHERIYSTIELRVVESW